MTDFRVDMEGHFTVPSKRNAESTKIAVIEMIKQSGFKEKDFIISIDKTELIENLPEVKIKIKQIRKKRQTKNKVKKRKGNKRE